MPINKETLKRYKTIGHNLKPVVTIAQNGLSENVLKELERAFEDHELIKVKFAIDDRDMRKQTHKQLALKCKADTIQEIGKTGLFFRVSRKKDIKTSNIR